MTSVARFRPNLHISLDPEGLTCTVGTYTYTFISASSLALFRRGDWTRCCAFSTCNTAFQSNRSTAPLVIALSVNIYSLSSSHPIMTYVAESAYVATNDGCWPRSLRLFFGQHKTYQMGGRENVSRVCWGQGQWA
jgi:hypothetical protein